MTIKKKTIKSFLKEGHEQNLPVHPSDAAAQVPDHLDDKREVKADKHEGVLPTHASDAQAEVPESLDGKVGAKPVKPELDGKKVADQSKEDGNDVGVQIPDQLNKAMKEELEAAKKDKKEDSDEKDEESDSDDEMKEHITILTSGEGLSEEFKLKTATLFEAAVAKAVDTKTAKLTAKLEEKYASELNEQIEVLAESTWNKLEEYLEYIVEEWINANQVAVDAGLKNELSEDFLTGFKDLFEKHHVQVPEGKENILESHELRISTLEGNLNEELEKNMNLSKKNIELERQVLLNKFSDGLALTEVEKFGKLCEGISFESTEQFSQKLKVIKENYFPKSIVKPTETIDSDIVSEGGIQQTENPDPSDAVTSAYMDAISRSVKSNF